MVILLSLPISLLVSTLRLDIELTPAVTTSVLDAVSEVPESVSRSAASKNHFIARLLSKNRNLTIAEQNGHLLADSVHLTSLKNNTVNTLYIRCLNDVLLRIAVDNASKTVLSPSVCHRNSKLS